MAQLGMFAEEAAPPPVPRADPDRVRRKLAALLAEARAGATALPSARRRLIETVVPQMVRWLPPEEGARIRRDFDDALAAYAESPLTTD